MVVSEPRERAYTDRPAWAALPCGVWTQAVVRLQDAPYKMAEPGIAPRSLVMVVTMGVSVVART